MLMGSQVKLIARIDSYLYLYGVLTTHCNSTQREIKLNCTWRCTPFSTRRTSYFVVEVSEPQLNVLKTFSVGLTENVELLKMFLS